MVKSWLSKARSLVLKHQDFKRNKLEPYDYKKLNDSSARTSKFKQLAGVALVAASIGTFAPSIYYSHDSSSTIDEKSIYDLSSSQKNQDLSKLMSQDSYALNQMASIPEITVISQNDKNIRTIINTLDQNFIPDYRAALSDDAFRGRNDFEQIVLNWVEYPTRLVFGSETSRRSVFKAAVDLYGDRAHAIKEAKDEDGRTVCFIQTNAISTFQGSHGLTVTLDDPEMDFAVISHELTHCQDQGVNLFKTGELPQKKQFELDEDENFPLETLQKEALADLTTALLIASHTRNWDIVDYTLSPFRFVQQHDSNHATYPWLDALKRSTEIDKLPMLDQKSAFEMASEMYRSMDFVDFEKKGRANNFLSKFYEYIVTGNKFENRFWVKQPKLWSYLGTHTPGEALKAIENYGIQQIRHQLNHIAYRSLEGNEAISEALLDMANRHANGFGDVSLKGSVADQRMALKDRGVIDVTELASAIGMPIDHDLKKRYENNARVISQLSYDFGLSLEPPQSSGKQYAFKGLPGNATSKQSLRERLKNENNLTEEERAL